MFGTSAGRVGGYGTNRLEAYHWYKLGVLESGGRRCQGIEGYGWLQEVGEGKGSNGYRPNSCGRR